MNLSDFILELKKLEERAALEENSHVSKSMRFQIDLSRNRQKHRLRKKYIQTKWRRPDMLIPKKEDFGWYWVYKEGEDVRPVKVVKNKVTKKLEALDDGGPKLLSCMEYKGTRWFGPLFVPMIPRYNPFEKYYHPEASGYDPDYDPGLDPWELPESIAAAESPQTPQG